MPRWSVVLVGAVWLLVIPAACAGDDAASAPTTEDRTTVGATAATVATEESSATASSTTASSPSAPPTTVPDPVEFDLEQTLQEFVGDGPGGAIALVRYDGVTSIEAAGAGDASGTPLRTDQPMRVGSISKPFIAVLVMQLVDEQRVDLDEQLGTYLPNTPTGADVTIAELLSHRSGIPNYTDQPAMFAEAFADLTQTFTPDDMIGYVVDVEPGQRGSFSYSNTNYLLLGQLIEALDGGDLGASLERRITGPLGLAHTWFDTADRPAPSDLAAGWSPATSDGDPETAYTAVSSGAWAAGALISTVDDLAVFLDAFIAGELLSKASFEAMTDTGSSGYGYGIGDAELGDGRTGWAHNGAIPGYHATMGITSDGRDLLAIMTNADRLVADQLAGSILTQLAP